MAGWVQKSNRIVRLIVGMIGFGSFLFGLTTPAIAQFTVDPGFGATFGIGTRGVEEIVIGMIQWFLGILALLAVVFIIYAGVLFLTSSGSPERIKRAKSVLRNAIIGLVIILAAWGIVRYLLERFGDITGAGGGSCQISEDCQVGNKCCRGACIPQDQQCMPGGCFPDCGGDQPFRIATRSPGILEENVPLCRSVDISFTLAYRTDSVVKGDSFKICKDSCVTQPTLNGTMTAYPVDAPETEKKGFVFTPESDFEKNQKYEISLTDDILSQQNHRLSGSDKTWTFSTGETTDTDPPETLFNADTQPKPFDGQGDVCRAATVRVIFDEAINPISVHSNTVVVDSSPADGIQKDVPLAAWDFRNTFGEAGNDTFSVRSKDLFAENTEHGVKLMAGTGQRNDPDAVRDLCGNPLDGNANAQSQGSPADDFMTDDPAWRPSDHPRPPVEWQTPWTFTTGVITECKPKITDIHPPEGYYSEPVTVSGEWLEESTDLSFSPDNSIFTGDACFDANFFPTAACYIGGSDVIRTKAPVQVSGEATVSGPLTAWSYDDRSVSEDSFGVMSPHLAALGPNQGPPNQFITLAGDHFGANQGGVLFRFPGGSDVEASFPCAQSWTDTRIIVKVPETLQPNDLPEIQVVRADGRRSNTLDFTVTSGTPGPGVCEVIPSCVNDPSTEQVSSIAGERFGAVKGRIDFDGLSGGANNWSDRKIEQVDVPDNLEQGAIGMIVFDSDRRPSNTWPFETPCGGVPRILNDNRCDLDAPVYPSPHPGRNATDQCRNVIVAARFDRAMRMDTVLANVSLSSCGGGASPDDLCFSIVSNSKIDPMYNDRGFLITPGAPFSKGQWIKVKVGKNVQSAEGVSMGEDDAWTFRASEADADCAPDRVTIEPRSKNLFGEHPQRFDGYDAFAVGAQCERMRLQGWEWKADNASIARLEPADDHAVANSVGENPENIGSTPIHAKVSGIQGDATFSYSTNGCREDADCKTKWCDGVSRCENGVCTPQVTALSPDNGPIGRSITVQGCHFGSTPGDDGKVTFNNAVDAPLVRACGAGAWNNDEIIVEVPFGIGATSPVKVTRFDGIVSNNDVLFNKTTDCSGVPIPDSGIPTLCSIVPNREHEGSPIAFEGQLFTADASDNAVVFANDIIPGSYPLWNDNKINVDVPVGAGTGPASVRVEQCPSNGLQFTNLDAPPGGDSPPGSDCRKDLLQAPEVCQTGTTDWDVANYACLEDRSANPESCQVCCIPGQIHQTSGLRCEEISDPNQSCVSSGAPSRGLYCGCVSNAQCGVGEGCGEVGAKNCCIAHPSVEQVIPSQGETNVCLNTAIEITFSELMDETSVKSHIKFFAPDFSQGCDQQASVWPLRWWNRILGLFSPAARASHPTLDQCELFGNLSFTTITDGVKKTVALFEPERLLEANVVVRSVVDADPNILDENNEGALSVSGLGIDGSGGDHLAFSFTTGDVDWICAPHHLDITVNPPGEIRTADLFTCEGAGCEGDVDGATGNQHRYAAQAKDSRNRPLVMDQYSWTNEGSPADILDLSPSSGKTTLATVTARVGQEVVLAKSSWAGPDGDIDLSQSLTVIASMCDHPWPDPAPYEDPTNPGTGDYNFSTWYCKDALADPTDSTMDFRISETGIGDSGIPIGEDDILKQVFFIRDRADGEDEAIGIRMMENTRLLSPRRWYEQNIPIERRGSPGSTTVDGYDAIADGNTYYIAATNWVRGSPNKMYNNIVIVSLNSDPTPELKIAFGQIVNNLLFTLDAAADKPVIVRDTKRITHLGEIADLLDRNRDETGTYPLLQSGTFLEGTTNSIWPSWNETLGLELSASLPKDPVNDFEPDCAFDPITCWNNDDKVYQCPADSSLYHYFAENVDLGRLYARMDYTGAQWVGASGQLLQYYGGLDPCPSFGDASCSCLTGGDAMEIKLSNGDVIFGSQYVPE